MEISREYQSIATMKLNKRTAASESYMERREEGIITMALIWKQKEQDMITWKI